MQPKALRASSGKQQWGAARPQGLEQQAQLNSWSKLEVVWGSIQQLKSQEREHLLKMRGHAGRQEVGKTHPAIFVFLPANLLQVLSFG